MFKWDKCTYNIILNDTMQEHIKTRHQSMNTHDFELSYNDCEIQSH